MRVDLIDAFSSVLLGLGLIAGAGNKNAHWYGRMIVEVIRVCEAVIHPLGADFEGGIMMPLLIA